jgi:hypothetical protein
MRWCWRRREFLKPFACRRTRLRRRESFRLSTVEIGAAYALAGKRENATRSAAARKPARLITAARLAR